MSALPLDHVGPWTAEELPAAVGPRIEIIDGSLQVTPLGSVRHQWVVTDLTRCLTEHAPSRYTVFPGLNLRRTQPPETLLIPDIAVVLTAAVETAGEALGVPFETVALVVEVLSPSSQLHDRVTKAHLYPRLGVGAYWVIDPTPKAGLEARFGAEEAWMSAALDEFLAR